MEQPSNHSSMDELLTLLKQLIAVPSFSKEESSAADVVGSFLQDRNILFSRSGNNIWAKNQYFDSAKPSILLNSHIDTVRPNPGYKCDPFTPLIENGKLYGLGSNDAGGPLIALLGTFLHFYTKTDLGFNVIFAATAEEEISGKNGIESIVDQLAPVHLAIVGEPTLMKLAVAERGLLVVDCVAKGKAGHAARNDGVNAIYEALPDIEWFRNYQFEKVSGRLGAVTMNVTIINAGNAHNQVPAECHFTVDIRLNEKYTHDEVLGIIRSHVICSVKERSTRIKPSFIDTEHSFVKIAKGEGLEIYGSPTTSDQALMPWPSVKIGPGDSARSHTADEFIFIDEIEKGLATYISLLEDYAQYLISSHSSARP